MIGRQFTETRKPPDSSACLVRQSGESTWALFVNGRCVASGISDNAARVIDMHWNQQGGTDQ